MNDTNFKRHFNADAGRRGAITGFALVIALIAGGAACSGASDDNDFEIAALLLARPPGYTITAELRSQTNQELQILNAPPITVSNNGITVRTISSGEYDGTSRSYNFTLLSELQDGTGYNLTARNSNGLSCTITNGSGTIRGANRTDVVIACPETA